jgi:hypothetical protein
MGQRESHIGSNKLRLLPASSRWVNAPRTELSGGT